MVYILDIILTGSWFPTRRYVLEILVANRVCIRPLLEFLIAVPDGVTGSVSILVRKLAILAVCASG